MDLGAVGGENMADDARLQQLIEEAKTKRLEEFRSRLEEAISKELCDILEISYSISKPEQVPTATFRANNVTWVICPGSIYPGSHDAGGWLLIRDGSSQSRGPDASHSHRQTEAEFTSRGRRPAEFHTKDDLLLLLDASSL
jgi:hypothetical protein